MNQIVNLRDTLLQFLRSPGFQAHVKDRRAEIERQRGGILRRREAGLAEQQRLKGDAHERAQSLYKEYAVAQAKADKILNAVNEAKAQVLAAYSRSIGLEAEAYRELRAMEDPRILEYRTRVFGLFEAVRNSANSKFISFEAVEEVISVLLEHIKELDCMFETDYGADVGEALAARHKVITKLVEPLAPHLMAKLELPDNTMLAIL